MAAVDLAREDEALSLHNLLQESALRRLQGVGNHNLDPAHATVVTLMPH